MLPHENRESLISFLILLTDYRNSALRLIIAAVWFWSALLNMNWLSAEGLEDRGDSVEIAYTALELRSFQDLREITGDSRGLTIDLLERINRRDWKHMTKGTVLQVPDPLVNADSLAYAPFPGEISSIQFLPKIVLVSLPVQAFAAYEFGSLVYWGPICSGSEKQETPANLYFTNWRSPRKRSTINRNWIMNWYFNIHTSMGLAFHQYAMPGEPVSYGCIRLLSTDARWIYDWADQWIPSSNPAQPKVWGTPVIVFGRYDYDSPPPWTRLSEDNLAGKVDTAEMSAALDKYLWVIKKRNLEKNAFLNQSSKSDLVTVE